MARYKTPIRESIGFEIYERYVRYCTEQDVNGIPDPYIFWELILVKRDKYPISRSGFTHWLNRLQMGDEPLIWRDEITKHWRLRDIDVQEV